MLDDADAFFEKFLRTLDDYAASNGLPPLLIWAEKMRIRLQEAIIANSGARGTEPVIYHPVAGRALWLAYAPPPPFDFWFAIDLARRLDFDFNLDWCFDRSFSRTHGRPYVLYDDLELANQTGNEMFVKDLSKVELAEQITDAAIHETGNLVIEWEHILDQYRPSAKVLADMREKIEHKQKFADLNEDYWLRLVRYLDEGMLLIDCLDLAMVSDRRAIEERLLLPPRPPSIPPQAGGSEIS
jgi:hypothetical protein